MLNIIKIYMEFRCGYSASIVIPEILMCLYDQNLTMEFSKILKYIFY